MSENCENSWERDVHYERGCKLTAIDETAKDLLRPGRNKSVARCQFTSLQIVRLGSKFAYGGTALTATLSPCTPSFPHSGTLLTSPEAPNPALLTSHRSSSLPDLLTNSMRIQSVKMAMILPANIPLERMCHLEERKHASTVL